MVEEILVSNVLSDAMVRVGAELIQMMTRNQMHMDVAAWIYSDESDLWRLTFAFPDVHSRGSRQMYQRIQAVLAQMPDFPLMLHHTSVEDSNEPFMRALYHAVENRDVRYGVRLTREVVQGIYIDDAYVYRLAALIDTVPVETRRNGNNGAVHQTTMPSTASKT